MTQRSPVKAPRQYSRSSSYTDQYDSEGNSPMPIHTPPKPQPRPQARRGGGYRNPPPPSVSAVDQQLTRHVADHSSRDGSPDDNDSRHHGKRQFQHHNALGGGTEYNRPQPYQSSQDRHRSQASSVSPRRTQSEERMHHALLRQNALRERVGLQPVEVVAAPVEPTVTEWSPPRRRHQADRGVVKEKPQVRGRTPRGANNASTSPSVSRTHISTNSSGSARQRQPKPYLSGATSHQPQAEPRRSPSHSPATTAATVASRPQQDLGRRKLVMKRGQSPMETPRTMPRTTTQNIPRSTPPRSVSPLLSQPTASKPVVAQPRSVSALEQQRQQRGFEREQRRVELAQEEAREREMMAPSVGDSKPSSAVSRGVVGRSPSTRLVEARRERQRKQAEERHRQEQEQDVSVQQPRRVVPHVAESEVSDAADDLARTPQREEQAALAEKRAIPRISPYGGGRPAREESTDEDSDAATPQLTPRPGSFSPDRIAPKNGGSALGGVGSPTSPRGRLTLRKLRQEREQTTTVAAGPSYYLHGTLQKHEGGAESPAPNHHENTTPRPRKERSHVDVSPEVAAKKPLEENNHVVYGLRWSKIADPAKTQVHSHRVEAVTSHSPRKEEPPQTEEHRRSQSIEAKKAGMHDLSSPTPHQSPIAKKTNTVFTRVDKLVSPAPSLLTPLRHPLPSQNSADEVAEEEDDDSEPSLWRSPATDERYEHKPPSPPPENDPASASSNTGNHHPEVESKPQRSTSGDRVAFSNFCEASYQDGNSNRVVLEPMPDSDEESEARLSPSQSSEASRGGSTSAQAACRRCGILLVGTESKYCVSCGNSTAR